MRRYQEKPLTRKQSVIMYGAWIGFIILYSLCLSARAAQAQTNFESYTYVRIEPQIAVGKIDKVDSQVLGGRDYTVRGVEDYFGTFQFSHQWTKGKGIFFETGHGKSWGETVIGPSFQVGEEVQISFAAGVDHFAPKGEKLRGRFNFYYDQDQQMADKGNSFFYLSVGAGKKNPWIAVDAVKMLTPYIGIGIVVQEPEAGAGVKVEVHTGSHLGFWVAPVIDMKTADHRVLIGGRIMWDK